MITLRAIAVVAALLATSSAAVANPEATSDLVRSKNCGACHHLERKMNGPAFKAIAERYAGDQAAAAALSAKIMAGGGGVWGPMAMPAQAQVSPEEAAAIVQWILSQR